MFLFLRFEADVVRGVLPEAAWGAYSEAVLQNTLLQLEGMDLQAFRNGDDGRVMDMSAVREFHSLFNANWLLLQVRHYCCKRLGEDLVPCCTSVKQSRTRMKQAARKLLVPLFARVAKGDTNKWCETSLACAITGHFTKCHCMMKTGSAPWRRKRKGGEDDEHSKIRISDDPHKKRRKRQVKSGLFWGNAETADRVVAAAMVTKPIRSVLGHMFSAEHKHKHKQTKNNKKKQK